MKHIYQATIQWKDESEGTAFLQNTYSRKHRWTFDGGITVEASASPQVVPEPWSDPEAVDPEEAFVASVSSCHMLWFLSIAAKKGFQVLDYRDEARGFMNRDENNNLSITRIRLAPEIVFAHNHSPSPEQIRYLHDEAHKKCFIANSIKSDIVIQTE